MVLNFDQISLMFQVIGNLLNSTDEQNDTWTWFFFFKLVVNCLLLKGVKFYIIVDEKITIW